MKLKKYLLTGVLIWLPIIAGIWTINYIISSSNGLIRLLPHAWQPKTLFGFDIPGLGLIAALLILLITGIFAGNFFGRKVIEFWDVLFAKIPIVKTVYTSVKKVSESLLSDSRQSFKTPLLVQFPCEGVWTIAFTSGKLPGAIKNVLGSEEYLSVYVPTTPNPTGGYYIMVKASDTRALNMTVDEALKYVISLGMVTPELEQMPKKQDGKSVI